jgi:hypothetical protein
VDVAVASVTTTTTTIIIIGIFVITCYLGLAAPANPVRH